MSKALFAGSFDPVHLGHLDIIRRCSAAFDEVVVAVTVNLAKQGMFTVEERMEMICQCTADLPNVKVDRIDGLRSDYVNTGGFDFDVRSLRNSTDLDYEMPVQQMFARLYDKAETVVLFTDPSFACISSNQIRQVYSLGGDVSFMVHPKTLEYMNGKFIK